MFQSFKNAKIKLNGEEFVAKSISLNCESNIAPNYFVESRRAFDTIPENGIIGSLKLDYVLTGYDSLTQFFYDEQNVISGNFGGLHFNSGYLESYSLQCAPNRPVTVGANIVFFEDLKGNFSPLSPTRLTGYIINASDTVIESRLGDESLTNVLGANYDFRATIEPQYFVNTGTGILSQTPDKILFGPKELSATVISDSLSGRLNLNGNAHAIYLKFTHPSYGASTTYGCSGFIKSRSLQSEANSLIKSEISVVQYGIYDPPILESFSPLSGKAGEIITIKGSKLSDTIKVSFHDRDTFAFTASNDTTVLAQVPWDAVSGAISVETLRGPSSFRDNFVVNHVKWATPFLIPRTGVEGDIILLEGDRMVRPTAVLFTGIAGATVSGKFKSLTQKIMKVTVPSGVGYGALTILSLSSTPIVTALADPFTPIPIISDFNPKTGIAGTVITLTGKHLYYTEQVKVGKLPATTTAVSDTHITFTIPAGFNGGTAKENVLVTANSITTKSESFYHHALTVTGVDPSQSLVSGIVVLSGSNFFPSLMYEMPEMRGHYKVSFNGGVTGFAFKDNSTLSFNKLSGMVPLGAKTGPIYIYTNDGASFHSSTIPFTVRYQPPQILYISHTGEYSGSGLNMTIFGRNLFNIQEVSISGKGSITTRAIITPQFWKGDQQGDKIIIKDWPLTTGSGVGTGHYVWTVKTPEGTGQASGIYSTFHVPRPYLPVNYDSFPPPSALHYWAPKINWAAQVPYNGIRPRFNPASR